MRPPKPSPLAVKAAGRPMLFAVPGLDGYLQPEPEFTCGLASDQPFLLFELPGLLSDRPTPTRVEGIAELWCGELAAVQPEGPVHLLAFCSGVLIACEMERQLRQVGRLVRQIVLVDPLLPSTLRALYEAGEWDCPQATRRLRDEARRLEVEGRCRALLGHYRQRGRDPLQLRYPGQSFSVDARAKFMAALYCYKPEPVQASVEMISSAERNSGSHAPGASPSAWDRFIPRRRIHVAGSTHAQVVASGGGITGALVQRAIDAPLDGAG